MVTSYQMATPAHRRARHRAVIFVLCGVLAASASNVCGAQERAFVNVPTDVVGVIAAELLSHTPPESHDWYIAVFDGHKLNNARQFCAAELLELLAVRLSQLIGHAIARERIGPDSVTVRSDSLQHVTWRPGVTWGIFGTRVLGDTLVVDVDEAINYRTQPRSWGSLDADYYIIPSTGGTWRIAVIRNQAFSDGRCGPGAPYSFCRTYV